METWTRFAFSFCALCAPFVNAGNIEFVVRYPDWKECSKAPFSSANLPCGPGIHFHVVLAPCPAHRNDTACWDPISSIAGTDVPLCKSMPIGGCLPAMPTKTKGMFSTGIVTLPEGKEWYALASVYWANISSPASMWTMEVDLAQRIPLKYNGIIELSPHFLPFGSGRFTLLSNVSMEQFGHGTVQDISIYEPPGCVENPAACSKAKVIVVTDGILPSNRLGSDWLVQRGDGLIAERRASPFLMISVPSAFRRANETSDWPCARGAMLTPGPCQNASKAFPAGLCGPKECDGTYGQNNNFFRYIGETLLPLVKRQFNDAGRGQRAGIVGYSYGGLTACNAAWVRPDLFDAAGCCSPSMWYPTQQCADGTTTGYLKGTYFADTAMRKFPAPTTTRFYVSDGTAEALCMGGTKHAPGPTVLVAQKMRTSGVPEFPFEENSGYQHDGRTPWFANTLWRALEVIVPYKHDRTAHLATDQGDINAMLV